MKEGNVKEKRRKVVNKHKFLSATNLPSVKNPPPGKFLISPADIDQYKKKMTIAVGEEKSKKIKPTKKVRNKIDSKEVGKILLEPHKQSDEHPNVQDYEWMIKSNIIKLMGEAKKKAQKVKPAGKGNNKMVKKTQSEHTKEAKPKQPPTVTTEKNEEPKPKKKNANATRQRIHQIIDSELKIKQEIKRSKTANLPREMEPPIYKQRPQTSSVVESEYIAHPQGNLVMLNPKTSNIKKKSNIQKMKSLFDAFKPVEPTITKKKPAPKRNQLSLYEELKLAEEKEKAAAQKKILKKSNKIPEKLLKSFKPEEKSSTIRVEKNKIKNKKIQEKVPFAGDDIAVIKSIKKKETVDS